MHYLETEDLLEVDPTRTEEEDDGEYFVPKEKLSFSEKDKQTSSTSVIDLDADLIEEQGLETKDSEPDEQEPEEMFLYNTYTSFLLILFMI